MTWFLVEEYAPDRWALAGIDARIDDSVRDASDISHLVSILIPEDETCFHVFDAYDRERVAVISEVAGLTPLRIVETVHSEHWSQR